MKDYHYIDTVYSPLKPRSWAEILYHDKKWDEDALFILDGVCNGFKSVDPGSNVLLYDQTNYWSCYKDDNYEKMNAILTEEIEMGKISITPNKPHQIHALGAIPKPNGSVRHITDCSRPKGDSINNFKKYTFSSFSFNTIDDVVKSVSPDYYMATVDLLCPYTLMTGRILAYVGTLVTVRFI